MRLSLSLSSCRAAAGRVAVFAIMGILAAVVSPGTLAAQSKDAEEGKDQSAMRVVTLGGDVTETVFALGAGDLVVGSDQGSLYPPEVLERPRLNYHRQMSSEGILSLNPDVVLLTKEAGPPTAIDQLRSAGVRVVTIPTEQSVEGAEKKITAVARALGIPGRAKALTAKMHSDLEGVSTRVEHAESTPKVLFLYSRAGLGAPMIGGSGTSADAMIKLAGGKNAAAELRGFKPLTPEALLALNPDAVLMLDKSFESIGGNEGLLSLPGMAETSAGKEERFVHLPDSLLLSFGPRLPEAVERLAEKIHPEYSEKSSTEAGD